MIILSLSKYSSVENHLSTGGTSSQTRKMEIFSQTINSLLKSCFLNKIKTLIDIK